MAPPRKLPTTANYRKGSKQWREQILAHDPNHFHRSQLKCVYGLDYSTYERMLKEQGYVCKLCGQPNQHGKRLAVDHDHETGQIRGLLCNHCNITLGRQEPVWFLKAINYLWRSQVPKMED